jgi:hypothetical protein
MRLAVYGAVLVIALGSVLLGLDRLPAPMSPMVDTAAGLAARRLLLCELPPCPSPSVPVRRLARLLFHRPRLAAPRGCRSCSGARLQHKRRRQLRPNRRRVSNVDPYRCLPFVYSSDCTYQPTAGHGSAEERAPQMNFGGSV